MFLVCRTEDRAAGWIRLTREILKLPEAPSVKDKEKHSKARRPQPLIKLVLRRYNLWNCLISFLFFFFEFWTLFVISSFDEFQEGPFCLEMHY
jgi:hypothetical protein